MLEGREDFSRGGYWIFGGGFFDFFFYVHDGGSGRNFWHFYVGLDEWADPFFDYEKMTEGCIFIETFFIWFL